MANKITPKVAAELVAHEGVVREAYRDAVDVWTWSIGITNSSGHRVYPRYKDNLKELKRCFEVFEWVLRRKYAPAVEDIFQGHALTEAQFGAALSFHNNTGGIRRALWAKLWKVGEIAAARKAFMNWSKPKSIIGRRKAERDLFFDGRWSNNGYATDYPVRKPSYRPDFGNGRRVEVMPILEELFG